MRYNKNNINSEGAVRITNENILTHNFFDLTDQKYHGGTTFSSGVRPKWDFFDNAYMIKGCEINDRDEHLTDAVNEQLVYQGYQGILDYFGNALIPHKATKHKPLTDEQRAFNSMIGKLRVKIEHIIRKIKIFRICKETYRGKGEGAYAELRSSLFYTTSSMFSSSWTRLLEQRSFYFFSIATVLPLSLA